MRELHAYQRNDDGTLTPATLIVDDDGTVMTPRGWPLVPTGRTERLVNWGDSSGERAVYQSENGGREYIVVL